MTKALEALRKIPDERQDERQDELARFLLTLAVDEPLTEAGRFTLRHQLAVLQRTGTRRPCFRPCERLFWLFLVWGFGCQGIKRAANTSFFLSFFLSFLFSFFCSPEGGVGKPGVQGPPVVPIGEGIRYEAEPALIGGDR